MDEASQQRTQQEETAYHEAGHALVAWLLGSSTQEIFVSSEGVIGYVRDLPISKRRGAVVRLVMVNMAGPIAHAPYLAGFDPNRDDPRASFQTGYPKVSGCADDHDVMREFANASEEGSMERLIVRLRISSKTGDTFNGWLGSDKAGKALRARHGHNSRSNAETVCPKRREEQTDEGGSQAQCQQRQEQPQMSVFKRGEIHGTSSAMARTDSRVATAGVAAVKPRSDQIDVLWQDFINALQDAVRVFNEKHLANVSKDFQVNCNSEDPEKSFSLLGIAFINIQTASSWSGAGL